MTDIEPWEKVAKAHGEVFRDIRPAMTLVQVARLLDPQMMAAMEAEAIVADAPLRECRSPGWPRGGHFSPVSSWSVTSPGPCEAKQMIDVLVARARRIEVETKVRKAEKQPAWAREPPQRKGHGL